MNKNGSFYFRLLPIVLLYILVFSSNTFSQSHELYVVRNTVSSCLNVRADHDADAAIIACLEPGTQVTVINTVPFWRQILFGTNQKGWVAKKFIEPVETVEASSDQVVIPDTAFLTVSFIDVGQGDAIWIQTFDDGIAGNGIFEGYSIVIDGGPNSSDNKNPLFSYMASQGYHGAEIEALLLTHPHADHFNGAETITRHFDIDNYYDPGYPSTLSSYAAFIKELKGTTAIPARAKHIHIGKENFGELNWGKEIKAEILYAWPGQDSDGSLGSGNTEVNNASLVLRLQYGAHVFLFMGDAEGKERDGSAETPNYVEKILLETVPAKLKATVLKIAHHGSETSSTLPFIEAVNPDVVVVESGRKSFGGTFLPDISTLERYCSFNPNVKIYRTDQGDEDAGLTASTAADGDNIIIKTNGKGELKISAFDGGVPLSHTFCDEH